MLKSSRCSASEVALNMTLSASAADRRAAADIDRKACCRRAVQQSTDIACPQGPQQQTRRTLRLRRKIEQTRQSPYRCIDPAADHVYTHRWLSTCLVITKARVKVFNINISLLALHFLYGHLLLSWRYIGHLIAVVILINTSRRHGCVNSSKATWKFTTVEENS